MLVVFPVCPVVPLLTIHSGPVRVLTAVTLSRGTDAIGGPGRPRPRRPGERFPAAGQISR
ncbi:hypothetical protein GCM10009772_32690 [Pseudonocardia alni subsp. carboxydivorans]